MRTFFFTLLIAISSILSAQSLTKEVVQEIATDGETLYMLEMITRSSSDKIYADNAMESLTGYVAYKKDGLYHCVYWKGEGDNRMVMHDFSNLNPNKPEYMNLDGLPRSLNTQEILLSKIKTAAFKSIRGDTEYFKITRGVTLTLHMLEKGNEIHAFLMANQRFENTIPIGNDFRIVYDQLGQMKKRARIRSAFTEIPTDVKPDGNGKIITAHINEEKPIIISPTDICNLLLYSPSPEMHEHHVMSPRFICIYKIGERSLVIKQQN
ncbi:MAG: hypothetical protein AB8F95_00810 [Bacteroidia bacterium]